MHATAHKPRHPQGDVPEGPEPGAMPVEPDGGAPKPYIPEAPDDGAPEPIP